MQEEDEIERAPSYSSECETTMEDRSFEPSTHAGQKMDEQPSESDTHACHNKDKPSEPSTHVCQMEYQPSTHTCQNEGQHSNTNSKIQANAWLDSFGQYPTDPENFHQMIIGPEQRGNC